jgi:hypothetical protein
VLAHLFHIPGVDLNPDASYPDQGFYGFYQSLEATGRIVPKAGL